MAEFVKDADMSVKIFSIFFLLYIAVCVCIWLKCRSVLRGKNREEEEDVNNVPMSEHDTINLLSEGKTETDLSRYDKD